MKKFVQVMGLALLAVVGLSFVTPAHAADPVEGYWKTIDDKDKKPKSIVKIWEEGGKYYGTIVKLFRKVDPCPKCDKCKGFRKNKPTCGIMMIWNLKKKGQKTEYSGGKILNPKIGKIYRAAIWIDTKKPKQLKVRGYVAIFFRTQTWHRASKPTKGTCVQKCGSKPKKAAAPAKAAPAKAVAAPAKAAPAKR